MLLFAEEFVCTCNISATRCTLRFSGRHHPIHYLLSTDEGEMAPSEYYANVSNGIIYITALTAGRRLRRIYLTYALTRCGQSFTNSTLKYETLGGWNNSMCERSNADRTSK
jgi:hypothetical protein